MAQQKSEAQKRQERQAKEQEKQQQEATQAQEQHDQIIDQAAEGRDEDHLDHEQAPELAEKDVKTATAQASRYQSPPEGRIIKVGEKVEFDGEELANGQVVVKEDVYQEFYPGGAKTPSWRLLYRAGTLVGGYETQRVLGL